MFLVTGAAGFFGVAPVLAKVRWEGGISVVNSGRDDTTIDLIGDGFLLFIPLVKVL